MSYQDTVQSSLCRIDGLQSEEGKKRNGCAAKVRLDGKHFLKTKSDGSEARYPVSFDGFPGPLSLKASNIDLFPHEAGGSADKNDFEVLAFSAGVGRGTFLDRHFSSVLVQNGSVVDRTMVEGESARSRGSLLAVEMFTKRYASTSFESLKKGKKQCIKFEVTDLNLARAFNRVANGDTSVKLGPALQQKFKKVCKKFPQNSKDLNIIVKFDSHRVHADRFSTECGKQGPQRVNAVKQGTYQIYPCALKQYLDALEVKYIDVSNGRKEYFMVQDIYLDYGKSEATDYLQHVVAMKEAFRLFPNVLAEVDPQMFWGFIVWMDPIMDSLEKLSKQNLIPSNLIDAWNELKVGKEKSRKCFMRGMPNAKGPEENWGIEGKSNDVHLRTATDLAMHAMDALLIACLPKIPKGTDIVLHTLGYYIGTDLDKYIAGQTTFHNMMKAEKEANPDEEISDSKLAKLYNKAMRAAGLERSEKSRMHDPEKICSNCTKKSKKKLMTCARCEGVFYCNADCQRAHWKKHKSNCSRVLVQLEKALGGLKLAGADVEPALYNYGSTTLPTQPSMISEVSGAGMASIFWNPNGESVINVSPDHAKLLSGGMGKAALEKFKASVITTKFSNLSDLDPLMRFLICCGPLPDFRIAKESLSDALAIVNGDVRRMRFPVVGFTPLEWAAKKGNMETVKWLCTDERTKPLLQIGCPVGWSCYTGQVDIARLLVKEYKVNPRRTDDFLWVGLSPLFVAAQNGQLEAMKFLVDECGMNIKDVDLNGRNVLKHIELSPNWREIEGHKKSHKWAKKRLRG